jgi:hypothetical protein
VETGWLGRSDEVSIRRRWSRWKGGSGAALVRYLRDMWVVRPGVGDGVLGGRGRNRSLGTTRVSSVTGRGSRENEDNGQLKTDPVHVMAVAVIQHHQDDVGKPT